MDDFKPVGPGWYVKTRTLGIREVVGWVRPGDRWIPAIWFNGEIIPAPGAMIDRLDLGSHS